MRGHLLRRGGVFAVAVAGAVSGLFFQSACGPNYVLQGDARKKLGASDQELMLEAVSQSQSALTASAGRGAQALPNTSYLNAVNPSRCDYYVDVAGNDANSGTSSAPFRTVRKAVSMLNGPGKVACVRPGTYSEGRSTTVASGTATAPIVVRAADPNNRPLIVQSLDGWNPAFKIVHSYWVIDGVRININRKVSAGIEIDDMASFVSILNSEVYNGAGGAAVSMQGKDIFAYKNTVHDNFKSDEQDAHAFLATSPAARILLRDNIAYNNGGDGFQCEYYSPDRTLRPRDMTVEGGSMWTDPVHYGRTEQAVDIKECVNVTIRGVEMKQFRRKSTTGSCGDLMVVHVGAENVLIEKNVGSDAPNGYGVGWDVPSTSEYTSEPVRSVTIRNNVLRNFSLLNGQCGEGISVGRAQNVEVYNNTVDGAQNYAIGVGNSNWPETAGSTVNVDVYNNIVTNSGAWVSYDNVTAPDTEIDYNLYFNANGVTQALCNDECSSGKKTLASFQSATGKDRNSLVANPMFLSDGSFFTAAGSPARDSAFAIPLSQCQAGQYLGCYCGTRGDRGAKESDCGSVAPASPSPVPTVTQTASPTVTPTTTSSPSPAPSGSLTESAIANMLQSSNTEATSPASLAKDGSLDTYWACNGNSGSCFVTADLGALKYVGGVDLAWHRSNERSQSFKVLLSTDNNSFTEVFSGSNKIGALGFQRFSFAARQARFVKIQGFGNSLNTWNSLSEMKVLAVSSGGTSSPTPTPTPTPTSTSTPTGQTIQFAVIGDFGNRSTAAANVANLVKGWSPQFVITTGDNNYDLGEASTIDASIGKLYQQFIGNYKGSYGAGAGSVNRFFPSLGNHDWGTGSVSPYTNYFTLPGNERYYTFTQGPVQFFSIDSDGHEPDGNTATSRQATWLKNELALSKARFKVVFFHHPPYSSGDHQSYPTLRWPFREWGASVVFSGHEHSYERVSVNGFNYVIQGSGGAGLRPFKTTVSGTGIISHIRDAVNHGASRCTASDTQFKCDFYGGQSSSSGLSGLKLLDTFTISNNAPLPSPTSTSTATPTPTSTSTPTPTPTTTGSIGYLSMSSPTGTGYIAGGEPALAVDGNLTSYFACSGSGCYLQVDLGASKSVSAVEMAFHNGNVRKTSFDVRLSADGASFGSPVLTAQSRGDTLDFERFSFPSAAQGRFIRIVGYGNNSTTSSQWTSIKELRVLGAGGTSTSTPTPTPTSTSGIIPIATGPDVLFRGDFETGNLSQWPQSEIMDGTTDRFQVVQNPVKQGKYAAKVVVKPGDDPIGASGERSEVVVGSNMYELEGMERWYRWQAMFPTGFPINQTSGWQIFIQWHQDWRGGGGSPPLSFQVEGGYVYLSFHRDSTEIKKIRAGALKLNQWHDFVFHAKWSASSSVGFVQLFMDGVEVVPKTFVPTMYPNLHNYLKFGFYRNESSFTTTLYLDGFTIGKTQSSVMGGSTP